MASCLIRIVPKIVILGFVALHMTAPVRVQKLGRHDVHAKQVCGVLILSVHSDDASKSNDSTGIKLKFSMSKACLS